MRNLSIKYIILSLCVILLIMILDQITKYIALHNLVRSLPITFFFSLTLSFNQGISFGMFNNPETNQMILIIINLIIVISLLWSIDINRIIPYSLIIGGAFGNIIDRLMIGAVIDFLHLHYDNYHFPIFNVADIAISIGCILLLIIDFIQLKKSTKDSNKIVIN